MSCWSGCLVTETDGPPRISYAAVAADDPFVMREGDAWRMLLGGGLDDGSGGGLFTSTPGLCTGLDRVVLAEWSQ